MEENSKFEKYQDFLNKRKTKLVQNNSNNNINIENRTEPSSRIENMNSKNVIQSYIADIKRQMNLRNQINNHLQNSNNTNPFQKNIKNAIKEKNTKIKKKVMNNINNVTNNIEEKKENKKISSEQKRKNYSESLYNSNIIRNKTSKKIPNYSNNYFTENKNNNIRYNYSSDYLPKEKELDHIISSYDFKNNNDTGDLNISTKIHFKNLLSLVKELKAKNDLLKKELRNKDNLISSLEKLKIKGDKKGNKGNKSMNDIIMNEYNDDILLDNQKLKSEILNLNKELDNQKIYYEDVIKDYQNQVFQERSKNNITEGNYKEIENRYKYSNNKIINIEKDLEETLIENEKLKDINQKYEIINTNQQKRIENLENQLNVILTLVKDLFNKENDILYPMRNKLFYEISNLNNIYQ